MSLPGTHVPLLRRCHQLANERMREQLKRRDAQPNGCNAPTTKPS